MPEELVTYFDKKYSELKLKAKTYGDLEKIIKRTTSEESYVDNAFGTLLYEQLTARLHEEWGGLSIIC